MAVGSGRKRNKESAITFRSMIVLSWLDRITGFTELKRELYPVHGQAARLARGEKGMDDECEEFMQHHPSKSVSPIRLIAG
jgi:hypothetical protein